jgi:hypothetical protein
MENGGGKDGFSRRLRIHQSAATSSTGPATHTGTPTRPNVPPKDGHFFRIAREMGNSVAVVEEYYAAYVRPHEFSLTSLIRRRSVVPFPVLFLPIILDVLGFVQLETDGPDGSAAPQRIPAEVRAPALDGLGLRPSATAKTGARAFKTAAVAVSIAHLNTRCLPARNGVNASEASLQSLPEKGFLDR